MSKSDTDIWKESLNKEENIDLFNTEPGGKKLPKKELFKSPKEKKLEERIEVLEKQVEKLKKEMKYATNFITETKRSIKTLKHKSEAQLSQKVK